MNSRTVKVLLLSSPPNQSYLEFTLIFDDGYEKHYILDQYAQRSFRGLQARQIVEEQAHIYYEDINEPADIIKLIFL